jgi:hypothetical protein
MVAAVVTLAALALVLAGCGSSSGSPSTADPAQIAPAGSLAYVEVTVRPQGSQRDDAQSALTRLLGRNPTPSLQRALQGAFKSSGLNYQRDIQPWLGQRIGVVVTSLSNAAVAIIAPTNNTSSALAVLEKGERNAHLAPRSYRGVNYQAGTERSGKPIALGIVGHDAVIGRPSAFTAIVDASHGGGLAQNGSFTSAIGGLQSGSLMRGYVNAPALVSALQSLPKLSAATRQQLGAALATSNLNGPVAFGLAVAPKSFTLQIDTGARKSTSGAGADVSALPGQAWLAIATGSFSPRNPALLSMGQTGPTAAALNLFRQRFGIDLIHDVFPALGPLQLSVQGTAISTLGAGLVLVPSDLAAATRVLTAIYTRVAHSSSLTVQGKPAAFTITRQGLPIPRFAVAEVGRRVLATFDEAFSQIVSPATKLADSARFAHAKAALPDGSRVPVFVDFVTLAQLTSSIPTFQQGGTDQKDRAVLQRLDYFVVGYNPGKGSARLVLGLR